jgi:ribosomal protein S27AE/nucleoid DNA-binding protein
VSRGLTIRSLRVRIARRSGLPPSVVAHVLDLFLDEVRAELMGQGEVYLRGLLRLSTQRRVVVMPPDRKRLERVVLSVKPVRGFRAKLNALTTPPEDGMDKYGVVTDEGVDKTAGKDPTCPKCGHRLAQRGPVPICERCGTEPWEKKRGKKDEDRA